MFVVSVKTGDPIGYSKNLESGAVNVVGGKRPSIAIELALRSKAWLGATYLLYRRRAEPEPGPRALVLRKLRMGW